MTSDKKGEANRRNAQKSTGPRTPEGKNAVRLNALRHGLRSEEILLPGEDEEALREIDERLRAELQPVGVLESLLVDRVVASYWRLRRLGRVEAGIFAWELYQELAERARREVDSYEKSRLDKEIEKLGGPTTVTDDQKHQEALAKAQAMEAERDAETATLGRTFIRDANLANAFSKLSRYETAIDRQIYRALHELERRQAARGGAAMAPPQVVDVEVSGIPEEG